MEESKINEAQVEEIYREKEKMKDRVKDKIENKVKPFFLGHTFEFILFFILGLLIGFALKTEASKRITIGFDDYKMNIYSSGYDINQLEKDAIEKMLNESASTSSGSASGSAQAAEGGSCQ